MTKYDSSQSVTMGGGFSTLTLINKHFIEYFKLKKVVFVVETTFSRGHFLDSLIDFITTRKGEEWR